VGNRRLHREAYPVVLLRSPFILSLS
jgi:hypothetical protein